jgi:hypothetical protein
MRRDRLILTPFPPVLTEAERREAVNQARMDRLLLTDPAPWVHATTMAEISALASDHGLLFQQAYQMAARAKEARYACLRRLPA